MKKIALFILAVPLFFSWVAPAYGADNDSDGEMIYSIFVDRFNNGDQSRNEHVDRDNSEAYQGGDLQGIIDRLDYIKDLGFTTISLSPIMENAEGGYHGYWIDDYFKIDSQFGSKKDLQELVKKAHERHMKVLLEFVPSFASTSHPMANDSGKAKKTKDMDLKVSWFDNTVTWNLDDPEVKDMLFDAGDYWLEETGIDGYHLFALDQTPKSFVRDFTKHLQDVKPDIELTGGSLVSDMSPDEYAELGISLTENPAMKDEIVDVFSHVGTPVENLYDTWEQTGTKDDLLYVDDPFSKRFTQEMIEDGRNPTTTWQTALVYLYTTPGGPSIYQGSEIPMDSPTFEEGQRLVEFNNSDEDLADFFEQMASLREEFPVLKNGDFELAGTNDAMSVFKRSNDDETMYIAINNDTGTKAVSLDDVPEGKQLTGLLQDNIVRENDDGEYKIGVDRESAEIFIVEDDKGLNWLFIGMVLGVFLLFVIGIIILSAKQRKRQRAN